MIRLGEILIQRHLISPGQLEEALAEQVQTHEFLGEILVRKGFVREENLLKALSEQFQMPFVDLRRRYIDWEAAMSFPPRIVVDRLCLPIARTADGLEVAVHDPLDAETLSLAEAEARTERVRFVLCRREDLAEAVRTYNQHMAARIRRRLEEKG